MIHNLVAAKCCACACLLRVSASGGKSKPAQRPLPTTRANAAQAHEPLLRIGMATALRLVTSIVK